MKILVIPTTDWIRHPVPNRLNFIFDNLAKEHDVYVLHFGLKRFSRLAARETKCQLVEASWINVEDPSLYYLLNFPYHLWKIRHIVKKLDIDVILSTNILPSFAASFAHSPVVFDYLDHLEESASIYYPGSALGEIVKRVVSLITRYNLRTARSVITVTKELCDFLRDQGIKDITVVPNGVDTKLLLPLSMQDAKKSLGLTGVVLGYVGSLEHWVDLETVVSAMPHLDATLLVVGPGLFTDYGDEIKKMAERLGVLDRIVFTGAVDYALLSRYISAMDIGLNPLKMMKKNEYAAGGKVFNYLACGRPVLSSRMISLEKLLGEQIYYYDDAKSFIMQVKNILADGSDEKRYRAIAMKYDWREIAGSYEEVLRKAAEKW
ncbi:MAG: D-inositol-3-phosphate glycosyltransferase [Euryarchaeota archaeon]|nr:D-inositol-3-phosphate glycosyltransferase [Euryarchaeota archaeon]